MNSLQDNSGVSYGLTKEDTNETICPVDFDLINKEVLFAEAVSNAYAQGCEDILLQAKEIIYNYFWDTLSIVDKLRIVTKGFKVLYGRIKYEIWSQYIILDLHYSCWLWKVRGLQTCPRHGFNQQSFITGKCKKCDGLNTWPKEEIAEHEREMKAEYDGDYFL